MANQQTYLQRLKTTGQFPRVQGIGAEIFGTPRAASVKTGGEILGTTASTISEGGALAGTMAGAYHGYKRNGSIGMAIVWALAGGIFWPVAIPIMFVQGFGKKK